MTSGTELGYSIMVCVLLHFLPEKNSLKRFILKGCAADAYEIILHVRRELFSYTGTALCVQSPCVYRTLTAFNEWLWSLTVVKILGGPSWTEKYENAVKPRVVTAVPLPCSGPTDPHLEWQWLDMEGINLRVILPAVLQGDWSCLESAFQMRWFAFHIIPV